MQIKLLKSLTDLEGSSRTIKRMAYTTVIACIIITLCTIGICLYFISLERNDIYVLDKGKNMSFALAGDIKEHRPAELRNHIKMFHNLFFSLSPDKELIEENVKNAIQLGSREITSLYDSYLEAKYYDQIIRQRVNSIVDVDSVHVDMNVYPYRAKFYGKNILTRPSAVMHKWLVTELEIRDVNRSHRNPHGFSIDKITILNNSIIEETKF